jgi:phage major head subunit gpT-like protein
MSQLIVTSDFAIGMFPVVEKWTGIGYKENELVHPKVYKKKDSTRSAEVYAGHTGLGLAVKKGEGEHIPFEGMKQGHILHVQPETYAKGFACSREEIEDNMYKEVIMRRSEELGRSARASKETLSANVFNNGFDSSYTYGSGKEAFADDIPYMDGDGTWANEPSVAADLTEASLEQAFIDIRGYRDEGHKLAMIRPKHVVVPPELQFDIARILESQQRSGTANNDTNALRDYKAYKDYIIWDYLTDPDAWFIVTDSPSGFEWVNRRDNEISSDTSFTSEDLRYKMTFRVAYSLSDHRGGYGSPGA